MKTKKRLQKISIILIILLGVVLLTCKSYGVFTIVGAVGIISVLCGVIQIGAVLIASALNVILATATGIAGLANGELEAVLGIKSIVFNEVSLTTASFFDGMSYGVNPFAQKIAQYYYIIRNISIAVLLFVLLYIGIRMVISTVAEQEAKYKKMLLHWVLSLVLVFMLHYIIIITFYVNDAIVYALSQVVEDNWLQSAGSTVSLIGKACVPVIGIDAAIVYCSFTVATVAFFISYIKRVITLGFLIVIAPLITITYAIDKLGDGKSQALDTWLKEFIFTVLIQPFHCIIYIVFVNTSIELVSNFSAADSILAIASVFFMMKAENIVKTIFGLKADSMGDTLKNGAMAMAVATNFFKSAGSGAKGSGGGNGGKMPEMKGNKTPKVSDAPSESKSGSGPDAGDSGKQETTQSGESKSGGDKSGSQQQKNPQKNAPKNQQQQQPKNEDNKFVNNLKKIMGDPKKLDIRKPVGDYFRRYSGGKSALQGAVKFGLEKGAAGFGFVAGAVLEDPATAVNTAMAAQSAMKYGTQKYDEHDDRKKLERNQEVFAGAYQDYAKAYREEHGDVSDDVIMQQVLALKDRSGTEIYEQYEMDMYNQIQALEDSGAAAGEENILEDTLSAIDAETLKPPSDYEYMDYTAELSEDEKYARDLRRFERREGRDNDDYRTFKKYGEDIKAAKAANKTDEIERLRKERRAKMDKYISDYKSGQRM